MGNNQEEEKENQRETKKQIIKQKGKEFREKNPNHFETYREKHRCSMEKVDLSSCVKNSVKFQKAMEKRRIDIKNEIII